MSLKQRILAVLATFGVLFGLGMPAANAYTVNYNNFYWGASNGTTQIKYCHRNYNWWEETIYGDRDGYYACGWRRG